MTALRVQTGGRPSGIPSLPSGFQAVSMASHPLGYQVWHTSGCRFEMHACTQTHLKTCSSIAVTKQAVDWWHSVLHQNIYKKLSPLCCIKRYIKNANGPADTILHLHTLKEASGHLASKQPRSPTAPPTPKKDKKRGLLNALNNQ